MLIGVAICTLNGVHLASIISAHPQGAHHNICIDTVYIYIYNFLAIPPFHHTQLYCLLIFVLTVTT